MSSYNCSWWKAALVVQMLGCSIHVHMFHLCWPLDKVLRAARTLPEKQHRQVFNNSIKVCSLLLKIPQGQGRDLKINITTVTGYS